jgi:hypothetical protein
VIVFGTGESEMVEGLIKNGRKSRLSTWIQTTRRFMPLLSLAIIVVLHFVSLS